MGVELRTERLRLRPLRRTDARRIAVLAGDLSVSRWLARVPHPFSEDEAERFVAASGDCGTVLAVEPLDGSGLIGVISVEGDPGRETLGYWLGPDWWGRGLGREAATAMVDHTFLTGGLDRLHSGAFERNDASLRIQQGLGFAVTGRRMIHCRALDRELAHIDTVLTRAAWAARTAREALA